MEVYGPSIELDLSLPNVSSGLNFTVANVTDTNMVQNNDTTEEFNKSELNQMLYFLFGKIICSFGITFNIINLCVLAQKELSESPYIYLMALAMSDMSFLAISFVHLMSYSAPSIGFAYFNIYVFFVGANICFNTSVWLIVFITIERMTFVLWPMKAKPTRRKALIAITCIFIFCAIINIPRAFCYEIVVSTNGKFGTKGRPFRESELFYILSWFHSVIINFVPNLMLIVTNSVLILALRRASKDRLRLQCNQAEAARRDQSRLTRMLIIIVIMFFICTIPSAFSDDPIGYALFGKRKKQTWTQYVNSQGNLNLIYVINVLLYLNSSLNFLLYCAFNQKFRLATRHLFWKVKSSLRRSTRNPSGYVSNSCNSQKTCCSTKL
ncbi:probable G-protein coupled receptor 139 [Mya arenaria]|uniref:probable G-protein coupled receptor 139 n=1 Tax=Mya arenaria TaxID=6604 RepID=UPI0022DF7F4F|nr:probable G-protein coupled receptor 139 [Mya arenaria]